MLSKNRKAGRAVISSIKIMSAIFTFGTKARYVKEDVCLLLVRGVSYNEVAEIVKKLPSYKAAGPHGYNAEFFKASWSIIGQDLVDSIRNFMRTGILPSGGAASGRRNLVAWKEVCKPKSVGGLGILNLSLYNKALMLGHLWDIAQKDYLWGFYSNISLLRAYWHLCEMEFLGRIDRLEGYKEMEMQNSEDVGSLYYYSSYL
ncbi:hypothetical protein QQ045_005377 [Rhodiola kirilowii]